MKRKSHKGSNKFLNTKKSYYVPRTERKEQGWATRGLIWRTLAPHSRSP